MRVSFSSVQATGPHWTLLYQPIEQRVFTSPTLGVSVHFVVDTEGLPGAGSAVEADWHFSASLPRTLEPEHFLEPKTNLPSAP